MVWSGSQPSLKFGGAVEFCLPSLLSIAHFPSELHLEAVHPAVTPGSFSFTLRSQGVCRMPPPPQPLCLSLFPCHSLLSPGRIVLHPPSCLLSTFSLLPVEEAWPHAACADRAFQTQRGSPSSHASQPESLHQAAVGRLLLLFRQVAWPPAHPSCGQ